MPRMNQNTNTLYICELFTIYHCYKKRISVYENINLDATNCFTFCIKRLYTY